jgi:uncharacterized repeat protein (TIGR01451 family)
VTFSILDPTPGVHTFQAIFHSLDSHHIVAYDGPDGIVPAIFEVVVGNCYSPTQTSSPTATSSRTGTGTVTPAETPTRSITSTFTVTLTATETGTFTATPSSTPVLPPAYWIKKSVDKDTANPCDTLTYTINFGTAAGPTGFFQITDRLPQFTSFVSATTDLLTPPAPMVLAALSPGATSGNIVWSIPQLNAGQSCQVQLMVKVDCDINDPTISSPGSGQGLPGGVLFQASFAPPDYQVGDNPSLRAPSVWKSAKPYSYIVKADPLNPSAEMCLIGDGAPGEGAPPNDLSTVTTFQGTTSMDIIAVTGTYSPLQEFIDLGNAAIFFNGFFLQIVPIGANPPQYAVSLPGFPLNHYLRIHLVYDPTYGCVAAWVYDETNGGPPIALGHGCGGAFLPSYDLSMFDNQSSNRLYVNSPVVYRGVFDTVFLQVPNVGFLEDCAGTSINHPALMTQTPLPSCTDTPTATPSPVVTPTLTPVETPAGGDSLALRAGESETSRSQGHFLPPGKVLVAFPNPAVEDVTAAFKLDEDSKVNLILSDLNGNRVQSANLGELGQGEHAATLKTRNLAPGIYYLILQTDKGFGFAGRAVFKLAKVR